MPVVVCAGQVVVDLFVPPLAALPEAGELITTGDMLSSVGGCSANTAQTLAWLGVPTLLSAMVGSDGPGDAARRQLAERGVDVSGVLTSDISATSQTVILPVVGEDRRYVHAIGANADYRAEYAAAVVAGVQVLAVGGFLSLPGLTTEGVTTLLAQARAAGTRTVLDVVIPHGADDAAARLRPVLPYVDCFTPNDDESRRLTGVDDPVRQARALLEWGARSVVITCGAAGAIYASHQRVVTAMPMPVDVVDASGAGDAFTAGLIFGMVRGWPIDQQLRFAAALGASATRDLGTTASVYTLDEALEAAHHVTVAAVDAAHHTTSPR